MTFFKSIRWAPIAIGFIATFPASSSEINLNDFINYSEGSLSSTSNFPEINPNEWAFKALSNIAKSRGCSAYLPHTISRLEAATILNSCIGEVAQLTEEEEILINEFSPEIALLKSRLDGLEARMNDLEASGFSNTTTATFSSEFEIGSVFGSSSEEKVQAYYSYQIDLKTSFTGEDSFDVSIDAGNANGSEFDLNATADVLKIDGIAYTFEVGNATIFFGDGYDGSNLFNTACVYKGPSNTLDNCGNVSADLAAGFGTSAGLGYEFGNGFSLAFGYEGQSSLNDGTTKGLMTKEGLDAFGTQLSYISSSFGVSGNYSIIETDETYHDSFLALNGYWSPIKKSLIPSVSVGYEYGYDNSEKKKTLSWFYGFQWNEIGPGIFGAAFGTRTPTIDNKDDEALMYEAFYSYPINDNMIITPLIYFKEYETTKTASGNGEDQTGVMLKTSFSF